MRYLDACAKQFTYIPKGCSRFGKSLTLKACSLLGTLYASLLCNVCHVLARWRVNRRPPLMMSITIIPGTSESGRFLLLLQTVLVTALPAHAATPLPPSPCNPLVLEVQINERLRNRLPDSNAFTHTHQGQATLPPSDDRRHHQGAPAVSVAASSTTLTPPCPAQQPTPQRQPSPRLLLSLFSEDGSDGEPGGGRDHNRGGMGGNNRSGWGGANPPPSQGQSLSPWEWPDICRGAAGPRESLRETGQKGLEYFIPRVEKQSNMHRDSDERDGGPPSLEGRRGAELGEAGTAPAGTDGLPDTRSIYGGLGHVKKRLWGSMFEGR